jgi:hypothetical protein
MKLSRIPFRRLIQSQLSNRLLASLTTKMHPARCCLPGGRRGVSKRVAGRLVGGWSSRILEKYAHRNWNFCARILMSEQHTGSVVREGRCGARLGRGEALGTGGAAGWAEAREGCLERMKR